MKEKIQFLYSNGMIAIAISQMVKESQEARWLCDCAVSSVHPEYDKWIAACRQVIQKFIKE